jgi:hypothetical protein
MIGDFEQFVVPMLNERFSKLLVLSDEYGQAIMTDKGLIPVNVPTDVTFYCSYVDEWINMIAQFEKTNTSCYPFLFINTNGLTQEGKTFTIREMVIATQSSKEWKVEEKRMYVINPILLNLKDILIGAIRDVFAVDEPFEPRTEVIYSEKERSRLPEGVDAIVFNNLKIREIC